MGMGVGPVWAYSRFTGPAGSVLGPAPTGAAACACRSAADVCSSPAAFFSQLSTNAVEHARSRCCRSQLAILSPSSSRSRWPYFSPTLA